MRNIYLVVLLFTFSAFSQSLESLKPIAKKLYDANYLMEFDAIADATYPKMYQEKGRDAFIEKLDSDYQNDEFRLRLQLPNVAFQYSDIRKIDNTFYTFITFRNPVRYFFEKKLTAEQAAEKKKQLQEINRTQDVTFEPARNSFNVKKITTYIAISDENTSGKWKLLNLDDKEQRDFFEKEFNIIFQELKSK